MPSLLIISALFPPEPVVSSLLSRDIADTFANSCEVTVLCPYPSRPEGFKFTIGVENPSYDIVRLKSFTSPKSTILGRFYESYSFGLHCVRFLRKNSGRFNCIYINAWPLLSQYLIIKEAKRQEVSTVLHVQDIYPESLVNKMTIGKSLICKLFMPVDKYVLKYSHEIIAISQKMKSWLVDTRNLSPDKISVVSNWQDESAFIRQRSKDPEAAQNRVGSPLTFMYLGNVGPVAGIDFVIKTFYKAKVENACLIIAGDGSQKRMCHELVDQLGVTNIHFKDVPDGMVPEIQDEADILLLPMKIKAAMSSIPSKLPAYMFSSKPIIGSLDVESDTAKAINNSGCGLVVPPEDETEFIEALNIALKWSSHERERKGKLGFEYAMQHFSKKNNLSKLVSIINRLL